MTLILPPPLSAQNAPSEGLAKLSQAAVIVERLGKEEKGLGLAEQELRSQLIALLQKNLPKLRVIEIASDKIYLKTELHIIETSKGQKTGLFGHLSLEVDRTATISATGVPVLATVWSQGISFLGPPESAFDQVRKHLDFLITILAKDWPQANP